MRLSNVDERVRARVRVLELAATDARVVAGAVVGSLAHGGGQRWSDLDLTFAGADRVRGRLSTTGRAASSRSSTPPISSTAGATRPSTACSCSPGCLQLDLSFTPASAFVAAGPTFDLLLGDAVEKPRTEPPDPRGLFGYAAHHALRARFSIERGRSWQAEHWIGGVPGQRARLACRPRCLPTHDGRSFDDLPAGILELFDEAFAQSLERCELLRSLGVAVERLPSETDAADVLATPVPVELRALTARVDD